MIEPDHGTNENTGDITIGQLRFRVSQRTAETASLEVLRPHTGWVFCGVALHLDVAPRIVLGEVRDAGKPILDPGWPYAPQLLDMVRRNNLKVAINA
ncbi:hypothetical protein [Natronoglycomyces albus]|uniref:Uncharacterized protein n=1 Tax=Natronoglycomyces albus TaxID=2811108 RepID=A0A895XT47_9ACTN|nr:hypothetical protein [Natronoglycomyces albus]QSB06445.1 hypothetical protein JQS30_05965 [Natronoglycomyces albus]